MKYFRNKHFSKHKTKYQKIKIKKARLFLKMADIDNNKLMELLIIAGGCLLLSQKYIKQRRKRRQWVRPWIRKRDSKGAYYLIINDLRLTDKEDFRKYLQMNTFILRITILQKDHWQPFLCFFSASKSIIL